MLRVVAIVGLVAALQLPGAPPEAGDTATIVNSGSTNRPGFRIVVERNGAAELTSAPRRPGARGAPSGPVRKTLSQALTESFYSDLQAAKPLSSLPAVHCAKSVSFGSTLVVTFGGEQTPDLSCGDGGNAAMRDLIRDANRIIAFVQSN